MIASEIIEKYISFFEKRGHKRIVNSPLVPQNDPTTLFASSGMQPLIPYLLGEEHPMGKRLVNVQNCFRAQDIDEVGDNRHTTFFRMLGNWSLGNYFKKEQLPWIWEFVTQELKIPADKLYITVFKGYKDIPKDTESEKIWTQILTKEGLDPKERIFFYDTKNWWSRAGEPDKMPVGEPGGPDSEIFFKFDVPHDEKFGNNCHPNCQCGRFSEIGNSVFMEFIKAKDGFFKPLPQRNVDFGGGLERLAAATNNNPNIFDIDIFIKAKKMLEEVDLVQNSESARSIRIILDHLQSSMLMIDSGIEPSNKEQGYILRRLIRRAELHAKIADIDLESSLSLTLTALITAQKDMQPSLIVNKVKIYSVIETELQKFNETLELGMKHILSKKGSEISGNEAFNYYQTYGYPPELIKEFALQNNIDFDDAGFEEAKRKHQELSRTSSAGKFRGGLADHSEKTIMGHTATHLLHKALRDMLGTNLHQTGSNITSERVRFDFNFDRNLTSGELKKVEDTVNEKIKENLPVHFEILTLAKAKEAGAIGLFDEKYSENVKVYFIGPSASSGRPYSAEFCGGPHVTFTSEIKSFKIIKQDNIGKGNRRIYAVVS